MCGSSRKGKYTFASSSDTNNEPKQKDAMATTVSITIGSTFRQRRIGESQHH